jgi:hypothetical protein
VIPEEDAMNVVIVALSVIGASIFALGFSEQQAKLERWVYQRHAED